MSKITKRFSAILVLALLVSIISPLTNAFAAASDTNLTIHKITGDSEIEATYGHLNGTEIPDGDPISGISFTYWKVTPEQLATMKANMSAYDTEAEVQALVGAKLGTTAKSAADGTVKVPALAEGQYWFIEDPSTAVKTSNAVPFGLDLPITNETGNGYITDLHVYPKNTLEDTPTIDKDVKTDGNKSASFNVGDEFNWFIQPSIVKGIEEYVQYVVTDKIDTKLDFQGVDKVTVELNGNTLVKGTDYNVTYDATARLVKVDFTTSGLTKLATAGPTGKLNILIPTVINESAVMGQPILNDATLDFDNGHNVTGNPSVPPTEIPKVYTGGKSFVKTDGASGTLAGAEFVIKNDAGEFLVQDATTLQVTWTTDQSAATKFTSDGTGKFEVKGLSYGVDGANNTGSTDYYLVETKAPSGYTIPTNPETKFTINATSYYSDPTNVTDGSQAATAVAQEIINKKTSIPNTGGMGTVFFTVVGLLMMGIAIIIYRKKQQA
ncbi:SpaH/EbpB family LPXTG-anchored major pilin [Macrococcus sp. EM39E]|uniref:SpaH/EbpB family LPXTG-anchored major pilin n=1 Tax=Macrococcus animalis TaxID=3395467 RepID=UPI0039BE25F2